MNTARKCYISLNLVGGYFYRPGSFSFDKSKMVKAVNTAFCSFKQLFIRDKNLVSLTCPSLQIMGKTQTEVFQISGFLVKSLTNENYHNSRNGDDIDIKLGPVIKIDKGNTTSKKKTTKWCRQIMTTLSLSKLKAELKISNTALILLLWVKIIFLPKMLTFCKNADISKIKGSWT